VPLDLVLPTLLPEKMTKKHEQHQGIFSAAKLYYSKGSSPGNQSNSHKQCFFCWIY